MPLEDQQQDELLNSYFDGEMSGEKAEELRAKLDDQLGKAVVDQELQALGDLRLGLRALDQASSVPPNSERLSRMQSAIMSSIGEAQVAESRGDSTAAVALAPEHQASWASVLACLAAAVLVAVGANFVGNDTAADSSPGNDLVANVDPTGIDDGEPGLQGTGGGESESNPDVQLPEMDSGPIRYVGDSDFQIQYCFVVDLQLSKEANENGLLSALLAGSGIDVKQPIAASDEIVDTLQDARSLAAEANAVGNDAYIYFVHAEINAVGKVLESIYEDFQNFPSVRYDLAFDSPTNKLLKKIATASGERFALTDSVAAPVALAGGEGYRASPFGGIAEQGQLVTRKMRQQGGGAGLALGDGKICVLMIVRPPNSGK